MHLRFEPTRAATAGTSFVHTQMGAWVIVVLILLVLHEQDLGATRRRQPDLGPGVN